MLTVILLLFGANFYALLTQLHGQIWKSGFFWLSVSALSVFVYAYGQALL
jgi:hypothetical protein